MEIFCKAIAESKDDGVKSFAIRTLKTFLQEGMYASELAATLASGTLVAESIAAVILTGRQLPPKIDAGICLLAMCGIDTNQLKHVVGLLPTLNDWMLTGPLISQHLALELIANLSSRFDLSEFILTQNSLHTVFELFVAIDDATMSSCDLEENEGAGFRKGYAQVRKTPSWPRSWANSSHLQLCSHRNAWANFHILGQPDTSLARRGSTSPAGGSKGRRASPRMQSGGSKAWKKSSIHRPSSTTIKHPTS